MNGAGDTYFSGKMLAKLARVLTVADDAKLVKRDETNSDAHGAGDVFKSTPAMEGSSLHSASKDNSGSGKKKDAPPLTDDQLFESALTRLKQGAEIWLNGSAESPLIYDAVWWVLRALSTSATRDPLPVLLNPVSALPL
jgi:hypothetical protein